MKQTASMHILATDSAWVGDLGTSLSWRLCQSQHTRVRDQGRDSDSGGYLRRHQIRSGKSLMATAKTSVTEAALLGNSEWVDFSMTENHRDGAFHTPAVIVIRH